MGYRRRCSHCRRWNRQHTGLLRRSRRVWEHATRRRWCDLRNTQRTGQDHRRYDLRSHGLGRGGSSLDPRRAGTTRVCSTHGEPSHICIEIRGRQYAVNPHPGCTEMWAPVRGVATSALSQPWEEQRLHKNHARSSAWLFQSRLTRQQHRRRCIAARRSHRSREFPRELHPQ